MKNKNIKYLSVKICENPCAITLKNGTQINADETDKH